MRQEVQDLTAALSDRSRKIKPQGRSAALVPLKFDSKGELLNSQSFDARKHLKRLSLLDLRFLKAWRASAWNLEEAAKKSDMALEVARRLAKRLAVFKLEDERVQTLADIPSTPWIAAQHVENSYTGELDDSQRDSLKELAKIQGSYKPQNPTVQNNVFIMPQMSADQQKAAREFFDTLATDPPHVD
jgi:hypothetical protein